MNIKLENDLLNRIRKIIKSQKDKKIFGISSISEEQLILHAFKIGLYDIEYLIKPKTPDELTGLY